MDTNYIAVIDPDEQPIEYTITHANSNDDDDTIYFYANRNRRADDNTATVIDEQPIGDAHQHDDSGQKSDAASATDGRRL